VKVKKKAFLVFRSPFLLFLQKTGNGKRATVNGLTA